MGQIITDSKEYAQLWQRDSIEMERQEVYARLNAITPLGKVLEVGTGTGAGTLALAGDREVLSLENNAHLVEIARLRIREAKASAVIRYDDACEPSSDTVSEILAFSPLIVTGWLIGTSGEEQARTVSDAPMENWSMLYRERVEDALVDGRLCPPSVQWIHLAKRVGLPEEQSEDWLREILQQEYSLLFPEKGFQIDDIQLLDWDVKHSSFPYDLGAVRSASGRGKSMIASILAKRTES